MKMKFLLYILLLGPLSMAMAEVGYTTVSPGKTASFLLSGPGTTTITCVNSIATETINTGDVTISVYEWIPTPGAASNFIGTKGNNIPIAHPTAGSASITIQKGDPARKLEIATTTNNYYTCKIDSPD